MFSIYEKRAEILNDNVVFSNKIKDEYGIGIVVLFNQESSFRKLIKDKDSNIYELHLTEFDAYNDAEKDYKMIRNEILNNERGIDLTKLLDLSVAKNLDKTKDIYENKEK